MNRRTNIALAAGLTSGSRRAALKALARHSRGCGLPGAQVVIATPRRFLSLRKLVKQNAAIDAMLEVMHSAADICAARDIPYALSLSDRPKAAPGTFLYLSHHTVTTPAFASITAQGAQVLHFKAADLPRRTCFDPEGFAGWASLASCNIAELETGVSPAEEARFFDEMRRQSLASRQSKYAQGQSDTALPERFVFVALQTIGDMVQRNAYIPMLDMLDMVVRRFSGTGLQIVVKRHPKCRSRRVAAALARHDANPDMTITQGPLHEIFPRAEAIFTVNSGVGAESLIHEKPLYCFGAADYGPAAHHIRCEADLTRVTDQLRMAVTPAQLRKFIYYYRNIYQVRLDDELDERLSAMIDAAMARAR